MSGNLDERLRAAGADLPQPTAEATRRAEDAALAALEHRGRGHGFALRLGWAAVLAGACLALGLGGGFALASSRSGADSERSPSPLAAGFGLGFLPSAGWTTYQSAPTAPRGPVLAVAANVPLRAGAATFPLGTINRLPSDGIVLVALGRARARAGDTANGGPAFDPSWQTPAPPVTGQTNSAVAHYVDDVRIGAFETEVHAFFGVRPPPASARSAAASELRRLIAAPRCPTALPLSSSDLGAARAAALAAAPHGVVPAGDVDLDYGGATASAALGTDAFDDAIRETCGDDLVARTAVVTVRYPRITFSASLSYSVFLVSRTSEGWVVWDQLH